ncbi:cell division protein ZapA [Anaerosacchariphilus polymeriproducens]|uniref:Cell division protein ZapA n=1 Tax=Anaerosacchariphilus polymeriproducens TaxID=1812858 RepID=A0A371AU61_9FIRM|nr:cell division protein ZapA [Anaerosacchariphilus polymeriproducens]RDU23105.1 cell division protein ZapA [Anaerosacchariphilus polymeriproducens]
MSKKTNTEVLIGGKVYTLSGYESEDYLQRVATYINNKISELKTMDGYNRLPFDMKATLLQLNIADDYFKAKSQVGKLETDIESRDREGYDLKHELISAQIRAEELEKTIKELQAENKELQLNKARLETSLEDVLFERKEK